MPALPARFVVALSAPLLVPAVAAPQEPVPLSPGMVVTRSVRIAPGVYAAPAPADLDEALIVVRGENLTLDLTGVRLEGVPPDSDPDRASGVAIRIEGGEAVTVRGGEIRGYRFGVVALGTRELRLLDNDLSYGWRPRLQGRIGQESLVDRFSLDDNDDREWMRFGAAAYLDDVTGGEIRGNRAVQGMNGFLLTRSDSLLVRDNEASYNSGVGIGLHRSSHNVIVRNRLDYNVRGYSHGFYRRGQGSAGLLLNRGSRHNVVAYNSATHSGDGLVLDGAGAATLGNDREGSDDNLVFHNDFSWATADAVEAGGSRNVVAGNVLRGSHHGVRGGALRETTIVGNCFAANRIGVAIEHGRDNRIVDNVFDGDSLAVALGGAAEGPGRSGAVEGESRNHWIEGNLFRGVEERWRLENTGGHRFGRNRSEAAGSGACDPRRLLGPAFASLAPELPAGVASEIPVSPRAGLPRSAIVVDAWGPWDGRSPKLWPLDTTRLVVPMALLGPEGSWRIVERRGVAAVSTEAGAMGDTLTVTPADGRWRDWEVKLEFVGEATVSPRGVAGPAGRAQPFGYRRFEPLGVWEVRAVTWDDPARDPPVDSSAFEALWDDPPVREWRADRLGLVAPGPPLEGLPRARWAVEARTTVDLPDGEYTLRAIGDDGIRVWVDGNLVVDAWEPHPSRIDHAPIAPGLHEVRVRYYQLEGWMELRVEVVEGAEPLPSTLAPLDPALPGDRPPR